jgi:NADPH:quinone reductase-like Zn-dependent oxidoreductase
LRSIETIKEFGVPESIDDREAPRPGAGEMVVAIQAAGVAMDAVVAAGYRR